jgi:ATP-dependent Clp protease ATP-binding subunit ClpC
MKYNRDEEALQALRIKSEELQKEIENYVYSQSYQKASNARDKKSEIEKKIQEMRSKKKIPKKDRLHVSSGDIQKIIEQITGVPAQTFKHDELSRLRHLESRLSEMILGQDEAIQSIVRAIKRSRA